MGQQANERKRAQPRTWAWGSAGWIAFQTVIAIIIFAAIASAGPSADRIGPCVDGPELGVNGKDIGDGRFVFPCVGGGTETRRFP